MLIKCVGRQLPVLEANLAETNAVGCNSPAIKSHFYKDFKRVFKFKFSVIVEAAIKSAVEIGNWIDRKTSCSGITEVLSLK